MGRNETDSPHVISDVVYVYRKIVIQKRRMACCQCSNMVRTRGHRFALTAPENSIFSFKSYSFISLAVFQNFVNLTTYRIFISSKCYFIYDMKVELESNQRCEIWDSHESNCEDGVWVTMDYVASYSKRLFSLTSITWQHIQEDPCG